MQGHSASWGEPERSPTLLNSAVYQYGAITVSKYKLPFGGAVLFSMGWYCRFIGDVTSPTSRSKTVVTDRKYNTKRVTTMCVHVHGFNLSGLCACAWIHSLSGLCACVWGAICLKIKLHM